MPFQPPPTYAPVVLYDKNAKAAEDLLRSASFNPIWLNWFLTLTQNLSAGGSGSGTVTSVAASGSTEIAVGGSPITTSGTLTFGVNNASIANAKLSPTTGVWTPADNSGASLAFTSVSAQHTEISNIVFAYFTLTYPATVSGANASVSGLPVTVANTNYAQVPSICSTGAAITGGLILLPTKNTTTAAFDTGTSLAPVTNAQLSGAKISCLLIYPST